MTRRRITAILLPVLAAIGIIAGTSVAATTYHPTVGAVSAHAAPAHPAAQPVVFNCTKTQVRPDSFTLTCADGNDYLSHLSWSSWSASSASGTGTNLVNDCTPYCAAGKFHSYPADVKFWRAEAVLGHPGQRYFSRVTLHFPGARPPIYVHGQQVKGPASWTGVLSSKTGLKPTQLN